MYEGTGNTGTGSSATDDVTSRQLAIILGKLFFNPPFNPTFVCVCVCVCVYACIIIVTTCHNIFAVMGTS